MLVTKNDAEKLLQQALNIENVTFREGQWEAIDSIVNKRQKTLVIQRTGWGKSAVYFIACKLLRQQRRGMSLIISPLLALMRNQIESATQFGLRAETINSANVDQWDMIKRQVLSNDVDCLFISPERLANEDFVEQLLRPIADQIALMVVDEAHCISDWGHDFRPDYRRITRILKQIPPNTPVLCTTATANDRVVQDIQSQLGQILIQRGELTRHNLFLQTLHLSDQASRLTWLVQAIQQFKHSGIVYTLTTKDAEKVALWLRQNGITAEAYHSEVNHSDFETTEAFREHLEQQLKFNKLKVLVATTALGMGYDKPDLSFVIHYQVPASVIGYYQQVGRAGRGIDYALGVLMSGKEDEDIQAYFRHNAFPNEAQVLQILHLLENSDGLTCDEIAKHINLSLGKIDKVLKFLSLEDPAPIIKLDRYWRRTLHHFKMDKERIAHLISQREEEWEEMQDYLHTPMCKMVFLRKALDDQNLEPCGKCSSCLKQPRIAFEQDLGIYQNALHFLRKSEEIIQPKKQVVKGAFCQYNFLPTRLPAELQMEEGRSLSRWGEGEWGSKVKQGKHSGYFDESLVEAMAEMIIQRWNPNPMPKWVCCVPSLKHPLLVRDFAERLAQRLAIPFVDSVVKIKQNEPQKIQANRFHQCQNLDGAFDIQQVYSEPVLLVDDVVDSGWTLAIISALLRKAGSGQVYPVALATSSVKE